MQSFLKGFFQWEHQGSDQFSVHNHLREEAQLRMSWRQYRNLVRTGISKNMLLHKLVNALFLPQPGFTVDTSSLWFLHLSRKLLCAIFPVSFDLRTCCSPPSCIPSFSNFFLLVSNGFFMLSYSLFYTKFPHSPPMSSFTSSVFPNFSVSMYLLTVSLPVHQRPLCILYCLWGSFVSKFHLCPSLIIPFLYVYNDTRVSKSGWHWPFFYIRYFTDLLCNLEKTSSLIIVDEFTHQIPERWCVPHSVFHCLSSKSVEFCSSCSRRLIPELLQSMRYNSQRMSC